MTGMTGTEAWGTAARRPASDHCWPPCCRRSAASPATRRPRPPLMRYGGPMHPPRPLAAVTLACCCAVLLALVAGCGVGEVSSVPGIPAPADASPLVRLHAVRTSAFPENHVPAFDATSSDTAQITQLYATIRALK